MDLPLIVSTSGIRGIVGEGITPEVVSRLAASYATTLRHRRVVLGSDTRPSREMCRHAVLAGLISTGCEIIDIGICPTPSVQIMVDKCEAGGGIAITASHNPVHWNALKLFNENGLFLSHNQLERILNIYHQSLSRVTEGGIKRASFSRLGKVREEHSTFDVHIEKILQGLNVGLIRKKKFRIALDCVNGAGSIITPIFLRELNCTITAINTNPREDFPHPPEPSPKNLQQLSSLVREGRFDAGFAQDPDADRLAIVTEGGIALSEECSIVLATIAVLEEKRGAVVVNLSTTRAIDDIAAAFGCPVFRSRIGERNVVTAMKRHRAVIGGEGSGGVIYPRVHYARDSMVAIGLILQHMAGSGRKLSEIVASHPRYHLIKQYILCAPEKKEKLLADLKEQLKGERLDVRDGIKIIRKDSWAHIRSSKTEPAIRILAEAPTKRGANELFNFIVDKIEMPD
ncbi:phosphoglucosamine mutase [candidate division NPL-UPA2 bacterium Unc8]|uniref:Phosphoglucosamine mutase n=1 Tax=candidate division NPL-UPA2 bacterium Unc8 TaxID=1980939 RepID=A0A399FX87_UNCN2|nr:Phosphoglucosamine mutase [Bacillota bacterium]MBT9146397.1 Phosphoglucosamine mutase [Bacillota bacterium]RII00096.1 MAG: phosphoglucosamine mutase [candidate division NPL-UPA2 bacterium Unc8]